MIMLPEFFCGKILLFFMCLAEGASSHNTIPRYIFRYFMTMNIIDFLSYIYFNIFSSILFYRHKLNLKCYVFKMNKIFVFMYYNINVQCYSTTD